MRLSEISAGTRVRLLRVRGEVWVQKQFMRRGLRKNAVLNVLWSGYGGTVVEIGGVRLALSWKTADRVEVTNGKAYGREGIGSFACGAAELRKKHAL